MIHIVIPAYNEAEIIGTTLRTIANVMAANGEAYDVLVVDDGSTDDTAKKVEGLWENMPVRVLRHTENLGPGRCFRTGLKEVCTKAAGADVVVTLEADGTSDARLIPALVREISSGADVVCASRYVGDGGYHGFPLHRMVISQGANRVLRWLFPIHAVTDYTIFFRAYRVARLKDGFAVFGDRFVESAGFAGNAEILVKLRALGITAREIGMKYCYEHRRGQSRMKVITNLLQYVGFLRRNWRLRSLRIDTSRHVPNMTASAAGESGDKD